MPTLTDVYWADSCRLIPSRYPPILLFESVADPADLEVVFAIEAIGNPRLRQEAGELDLVPMDHRISGPGTSPIMAAFTHLNSEGSRFTDGTFGVYYAGRDLDTAIAEVSHHRARFLARTAEPPIDVDMRCYRVIVNARMVDIRGKYVEAALVDPNSYTVSQTFGIEHRNLGAAGIVYESVRHTGGECVALFTPKATEPPARQAEHIALQWDGTRVSSWYQKSNAHDI